MSCSATALDSQQSQAGTGFETCRQTVPLPATRLLATESRMCREGCKASNLQVIPPKVQHCSVQTGTTHLAPAQIHFDVCHSFVAACRKAMLAVEAILFQKGWEVKQCSAQAGSIPQLQYMNSRMLRSTR